MDVTKEVQMGDTDTNHSMEEDSDNDDETWDELHSDSDSHIVCLFCPHIFKTMVVALEHCKIEHQFSLIDIKLKYNMDCYSYICMINYIRKEGISPESLMCCKEPHWAKESYLTPVFQDDPWLMFDFEGLESSDESMDPHIDFVTNPLNFSNFEAENGIVTLPESSFTQLQQSLKYYVDQVEKQGNMLSAAMEQINEMKTVAAKIVCGDLSTEEKELEKRILKMRISDDGYFRSYSHYGIHHQMLSDEIRMKAFRDAILENSQIFTGKTILDVGCGSGILSMFAASANAGKVFGIDMSEIIFLANDIVRENNLSSKIELIHGKIEDISLPVEKVDIIVSEWLGYFLLFEGMLDSVLHARDKYLKPDGLILPNRCCLFLTGLSDQGSYDKMVRFWSNVSGYKMSCLAREVLQEALISDVNPETIATTAALILDLNLYVCRVDETDFTSDFTLESQIDGELTALCGYFSVLFSLPHDVQFSTSPNHAKTHWKQTVFYLPQPLPVQRGMILKGQIECRKKPEDNRCLIITIRISDQKNEYILA